MSYENYLIREMTECAPGDTNCSDCGQVICACESFSDWLRTVDSEPDVCVPAGSDVHAPSFSEWLESHGDSLTIPSSFSEWLNQNGDMIIQ